MKPVSLVVWDWNGTLFDDVPVSIDTINELLLRHAYPPLQDTADYHSKFCFPIIQYYRNLGIDFDRTPFDAMAHEFMDIYHKKDISCGLVKGAQETLAQLKSDGISQVLISASMQQHLENQVDRFPIRPYFENLLGISDIYAQSKAHIALRFFERTGIDPQTVVFIGDSVHDYEVAAGCGAQCVLYTGGHQPAEKLAATGAPLIDSLPRLAEYCRQRGVQ